MLLSAILIAAVLALVNHQAHLAPLTSSSMKYFRLFFCNY